MTTVTLEALITPDALGQAVSQVADDELEAMVAQVLTERAKRIAPRLTSSEATLLRRINEPIPPAARERYRELIQRQDQGSLTPNEHAELLDLTDVVELGDADRAAALVEWAEMHGTTLPETLQRFGLNPKADE